LPVTGKLDPDTYYMLERKVATGWVRPGLEKPRSNDKVIYDDNLRKVREKEAPIADPNKDIQHKLKEMGFNIGKAGVDGKIGNATKTAIRQFQETFGLPVTGELDQATRERIAGEYLKGAVVKSISNNKAIPKHIDIMSTQRHLPVIPKITNKMGERSPEKYNKVIDQFDVESNPRYKPQGNTYCNIFLWDVTSTMGAEIPHWVNSKGEPCKPLEPGSYELNANAIADWLREHGEKYGWVKVTAEEAQMAANRGEPAITVWKNPNPKRSGHVQVVRPSDKPFDSTKGVRVAQAGRVNFNYGYSLKAYSGKNPKLEYYIHK
ncbi:MAG TPA: peptidoglycan-binding domain-containing protein, partial [Bacillota bacterium]|nr:peptidoglycan-binding domain-containing protein [Bacillota bacterium]